MSRRTIRHLVLVLPLLAVAPAANAQPAPVAPVAAVADTSAFDRDVALGVYYSHWGGDYHADGIGFRLRWEISDAIGIETLAEVLDFSTREIRRLDIPIGFNLYVPIDLFGGLRLKPFAGLCAMFSFATETQTVAQSSSDDIRFGAHAGVGLEFEVASRWSLFVDGTYQVYFGHQRELEAWATSLGREIETESYLQAAAGVQFHL